MLSVEEARAAVALRARSLSPLTLPLENLRGLILAEDVVADLDLPPFDKALMDGYAVRSVDIAAGRTRLRVIDRVVAGEIPRFPIGQGEAVEIMTGAPMPEGADAVVMVEHSTRDGDFAWLDAPSGIVPGKNRLERGREMRRGDVVVRASTRLTPLAMGVMASVGKTRALVIPRPKAAIVSTGDELVDPDQTPGPGQIRNSNATTLRGLVQERGFEAEILPIARDNQASLTQSFSRGLEADVLLISGGVSAGKLDLVPEVLASLGVECVFHKVRIKPGKPIWFGVGPDRGDRPGTLVFGLPGNPMSSVVGFVLFVRDALEKMAGNTDFAGPRLVPLPLVAPFQHSGDRPTYHPARPLKAPRHGLELLVWSGSSDLRGATYADGLAVFPAGDRHYDSGEFVDFLPIV